MDFPSRTLKAPCYGPADNAAGAGESDKTRFMTAAIANIEVEAAQHPASDPHLMDLTRVCIPVPFADFDFYYTSGLLIWSPNPGQLLDMVVVPDGFCTDLTSVPQMFWSAYPKTGRYAYAAIAHDYLYWTQKTTREAADDVLFAAMGDSNVNSATQWIIYGMVRKFGQSAWDGNAQAKIKGEKRFLKVMPPEGQLTAWSQWNQDPAHFSD